VAHGSSYFPVNISFGPRTTTHLCLQDFLKEHVTFVC
jgi:hypothetical protein